jgi:valyl-tRNA synthetase
MVMMGEKMLGRQPFNDVVIHGTVLDGEGKIMSKSTGNGVDPLDIIDRYGADAMRFTLMEMATGGQDLKLPVQIVCPHCQESQEFPKKRSVAVMQCKKCKKEFQQPVPNEPPLPEPQMGPLDIPRFEKGRNFSNKVWNASRYVLTSLDALAAAGGTRELSFDELRKHFRDEDRWILSRLNSTVQSMQAALDEFEFSKAAGTLYDFFWNEFCSWYIELSKPRLTKDSKPEDSSAAQAVLLYTLDRSLRLLHPFCPFLTEALWAELQTRATLAQRNLGRAEYKEGSARQDQGMLITAAWPQAEKELIDPACESQFASLFESVIAVRAVRQELVDNAPKERKKEVAAALAKPLKVVVRTTDKDLAARLKSQAHVLENMADTEPPTIGDASIAAPKPSSATAIRGGTVYVALTPDMVEIEKLRLAKEIGKIEQYIPRIEGKLKNENFVKNAPAELVEEERQRLKEQEDRLKLLRSALAEL